MEIQYQTPRLVLHSTSWPANWHIDQCWYVVKHSVDPDIDETRYLKKDGTWHRGMDPDLKNGGGTYFKTLEEVIAVLAEFEINVQGTEPCPRKSSKRR